MIYNDYAPQCAEVIMGETVRVAIVEDDAQAREKLRGYFSDFSAEQNTGFDVSE